MTMISDIPERERKAVLAFVRNIFLAGVVLGMILALLLDRL